MFKRKNKSVERRQAAEYNERHRAFSYHASRMEPESRLGRNDERGGNNTSKLRRRLLQLPIFLSVVAIVAAALYSTLLDTDPRIMLVGASGASVARSSDVYRSAASSLLSRSLLSRTKVTINTDTIENELKKQFPEINSVSVNLPLLGKRPIVQIETAKPVMMLTSEKSGSFYVTRDGIVTSLVSEYASKPAGLPVVVDQSGLEVKAGSQILSPASVSFIEQVIYQVNAKGVKVKSFNLTQSPFELWAYFDDNKYYVKFDMEGDARVQAGTYLAVRDYLAGKGETPGAYIDVRVEDKAFYK